MPRKHEGRWIIFRDAPAHLGIDEDAFLNALRRYDVKERFVGGMVGFTETQLDRLRHMLSVNALPSKIPAVGKVYIAKTRRGRSFKIGFSTNPGRRVAELQTAHHGRLEVIHEEAGERALEKSIHRALAAHRQEGEWFALNEVTRAFIDMAQKSGFGAALGANLGHFDSQLWGNSGGIAESR